MDSDDSDNESIHSEINDNDQQHHINNYNSSNERNTDNEEDNDLTQGYNDESNSEDDIEEIIELQEILNVYLNHLIDLLWILQSMSDNHEKPSL